MVFDVDGCYKTGILVSLNYQIFPGKALSGNCVKTHNYVAIIVIMVIYPWVNEKEKIKHN